jgi:hypothetical protein
MRHEYFHIEEIRATAERPLQFARAAPRRRSAAVDLSDLLLLGFTALALVAAIVAQIG